MLSRPSRIAKIKAAQAIQEVDELSELSDSSTSSSSSNDKAPVPPRKSYAQPRTSGKDEDGGDDDESDDSESDEPTAPPVKRRRMTRRNAPIRKKGKGKNVTRRGYAGKLSKLPELSLDVLFTIFSLLHPKDLMHLTCVSKLFRDTLLAPSASSIWINSRKDFGYGCPAPGEGLSESYWAHFLWNSKCYVCEASGVPGFDFAWRKRICRSCFMQYTTRRNQVAKLFPRYNILVLELISPPSELRYASNRFWTEDIKRVGKQLHSLERNAKKTSDGKIALDEYIAERKRFVKSVQDYAEVCKAWYGQMCIQSHSVAMDDVRERKTEIIRRFKELGYGDVELNKATRWQSSLRGVKALTNRSWAIVRPTLERDILVARANAFPNGPTKDQRFELLHTVYQRYRLSKFPDPHDWISLPNEHIVRQMTIFNELLYTSPDTQLTEHQFQDIIDQGKLDVAIQKFKFQRERALKNGRSEIVAFLAEEENRPIKDQYKALELGLPSSSSSAAAAASASSLGTKNGRSTTRSRGGGDVDLFSLALSVFQCKRCSHFHSSDSVLIGGEAIERHIPTRVPTGGYLLACDTNSKLDDPWQDLTFRRGARQVLMCLLETLKVDKVEGWKDKKVEEVTIKEMDRLDARWICEKCFDPPKEVQGVKDDEVAGRRYLVCHWRAAVYHCLSWDTYGYMSSTERHFPHLRHVPKFKLLSPRDTERVKNELEVEQWNVTLNDNPVWWCTKCVLDKPLSRSEVLEHVKATHDAEGPEECLMLAPGHNWPSFKDIPRFSLSES